MTCPSKNKILVGNSFPLSLIRRRVVVEPCDIDALRRLLPGNEVVSFWGHRNTLAAAGRCLGVDLAPEVERPVLSLTAEKLPMYGGWVFDECWVLSPDYRVGFRPAIGEEVPAEQILGWQCLHIVFPSPDGGR